MIAITTVTATSSSTTATGTMIVQTCMPGEPIIKQLVYHYSIKTHLPTLVGVTEGDMDTATVMNIEVEVEVVTIVMEDSIEAP